MTPSIRKRVAAVILAGAFVLAGSADVYGLHHCPHHDHRPVSGSSPAGPAHAEADREGPHADHAPARDHEDGPPCTCVGSCHASASAPLLSAGPAVEAEPAAAAPSATAGARDVLPAAPAPYLTPYPTGPPSRT